MSARFAKPLLAIAASLLGLCATVTATGPFTPNLLRMATLNGVHGLVYYSVVDGGYRPVAALAAPDEAASRVAEAR